MTNVEMCVAPGPDGTFTVRTNGFATQGRPEVEIGGVPEVAVQPAAKLIDYVVEAATAKGAPLVAEDTVGVPLVLEGEHGEHSSLAIVVRLITREPPSGSLFARLRGTGDPGVLRLADLMGARAAPPFGSIATVMLHRAMSRSITGDAAGAVAELRASLALVPGHVAAGPPPKDEFRGLNLNWQNHQSYLRLAELVDVSEATALQQTVYGLNPWLSVRELGYAGPTLNLPPEGVLAQETMGMVQRNLSVVGTFASPTPQVRCVLSPLWTVHDGHSVRQLTVLPACFVDYYHGGRLAHPEVTGGVARLVASCLTRHASRPWELAAMTKWARETYRGEGIGDSLGPARPWWFLASAVVAEAARYLAAGATWEELQSVFGVAEGRAHVPDSLAQKMENIRASEVEHYIGALESPFG